MDRMNGLAAQISWIANTQIKIYLVAFLYLLMLQHLFIDKILIFLLVSSVWIPQIIVNTIHGQKGVPDIYFAAVTSLHLMYIPLYFKMTENNYLFLRPDRQSGFIMMCYTLA